jgi:hypothetical protein
MSSLLTSCPTEEKLTSGQSSLLGATQESRWLVFCASTVGLYWEVLEEFKVQIKEAAVT